MLTHSISPMGVFIKTKKKTKEKSIIKLKNKKKIENKLAVQGSEKKQTFSFKKFGIFWQAWVSVFGTSWII